MPTYELFGNNAPISALVGDNGYIQNYGPGTVYFSDSRDLSLTNYEGTVDPGAVTSTQDVQYLIVDTRATILVFPGFHADPTGSGSNGANGAPGPAGPVGPAGPPGQPGQNSIASSDAVRGQQDRFYRIVGGTLTYDGQVFNASSDSFSRPQNMELVTTDSAKVTVTHEVIGARAVVSADAPVGPNLKAVGISTTTRVARDLKSTDIILTQTRSFDDSLSNPGDGSDWVLESGVRSPFTASGLDGNSVDFAAEAQAISGNLSHLRFVETSGSTIQDASANNNDGAVVSTGTTYSIATGLANDPTDKAMRTATGGTNEFTLAIPGGMTNATYSVVWYGKLNGSNTVVFRDGNTTTSQGHFVGKSGSGSTAVVFYRTGTGQTYTTTHLWNDLADGDSHLVVLAKSGANVALYIDGDLVHSATNAPSTGLATAWHLGRSGQNGTTVASEDVTMDEFAIYNTQLVQADVDSLWYAATSDGMLHITHDDIGNTQSSGIRLTPQGTLRPVLVPGSVTATGFNVKFYNSAGTQIVVADSGMALGASREVRNQTVDPTDLQVNVIVSKQDTWVNTVDATAPFAHVRLGDSSGTVAVDRKNALNGTYVATTTLGVAGAVVDDADTGVTLDGAQGKVTFANPVLTSGFSLHLLFKQTGVGSVGNTALGSVFGWTPPGGSTRRITVSPTTGTITVDAGGSQLITTGAATLNEWNALVYTWDGITQRLIVNGQVVAEGVTSNIVINNPLFLGSYLATSTNYSFKGSMDEFIVWKRAISLAEAQQLYATAFDTAFSVDRATESQIGFRAEFETFAPPPDEEPDNPVPVASDLPDGDIGGAAASYVSLAPYRSDLDFGPSAPWAHRALPVDRDSIELNGLSGFPAATSDAWRRHVCSMFGVDATTGEATTGTQGNPSVYLRTAGERIYVIEDDQQPRRFIDDTDSSVSGWSDSFEAAEATVGNLPVPADAIPHATADRYAFIYEPPHQWATIYAMQAAPADRATSTVELTSSPSAGAFFLEFDYLDSVNGQPQTFFVQAPVFYNCTADQLKTAIFAAKTTAGSIFASTGTRANVPAAVVTGGPLNAAPLVISWPMCAPLQPVAMRITSNSLNAGSVQFSYTNAGVWGNSRLASITDPNLTDNHQPHIGPGTPKPATAAATHIDWMPLIVDWNEYKIAYDIGIADGWDAPGTDLGHVIPMSIGNCGSGFVYPATAGDGTLTNTDRSLIVEGALMTFPLDADSSRVRPEFMPIFNTIQRYGVVPIDKTGGGAEIIFRSWTWPGLSRPFPGPSTFQLSSLQYPIYMKSLPWHQLQIIDPVAVEAGW